MNHAQILSNVGIIRISILGQFITLNKPVKGQPLFDNQSTTFWLVKSRTLRRDHPTSSNPEMTNKVHGHLKYRDTHGSS